MAVSKIWAVKGNLGGVLEYAKNKEKTDSSIYSEKQYQALADVLQYAANEEKTETQFFVEGINCNPSTARQEFISIKRQFDKEDGIQAWHGYLSFDQNEVTPTQAQAIGMEFANKVWGERFQVIVTTHLNTKHLHCHFVVNSISFKDGLRAHSETNWFRISRIADEICKEHGLTVVDNDEYEPYDSIAVRTIPLDSYRRGADSVKDSR
ncbi:MAG: relaxase/mobilization nuclease domain-containing protein [Firmicutes bacterium]|nr:relaxase/mobilization nuclease domain-containing protein [Bacillota bacterium]